MKKRVAFTIFGLHSMLTIIAIAWGVLEYNKNIENNFLNKKLITMLNGCQIILALEGYHSDHGEYPASLDLLDAQYIESIPQPVVGPRQWTYFTEGDNNQIFCLNADTGRPGEELRYSTILEQWGYSIIPSEP